VTFPTRYDAHERGRFVEPNDKPSMTKQSFKQECDINHIMAKYLATGMIPAGTSVGRYGDFSAATDYLDAQLTIKNARDQFASLPAKVRERFNNDPFQMLEWIGDKDNLDEANELGLLSEEASSRIATSKATAAAALLGPQSSSTAPTFFCASASE